MRRVFFVFTMIALLVPSITLAERLELGFALTPTLLQDDSFEAFSSDSMSSLRFGADIRSEVAAVQGFKFLPLLRYRGAYSEGKPYYILDTKLSVHDFSLGVRVRKGILSWMSAFIEAYGGLVWALMDGRLTGGYYVYNSSHDPIREYEDSQLTWQAGGLLGLEFAISKSWLRSRGVKNFGFGGELGGGYVRRGDISFDPEIRGGDDSSLDIETLGSWGEVNLSGWFFQLGFALRFF